MNNRWLTVIIGFLVIFSSYHITIAYSSEAHQANITIIGKKSDDTARNLYDTAVKLAPKEYEIIWINSSKEKIKNKKLLEKYPSHPQAVAYVCAKNKCSLPAFKPEQLIKLINYFTSNNMTTINNNTSASLLDRYQSNIQTIIGTNKWWAIIAIFWFIGLLLALTPCVLPLLIIITTLLGGQAGNLTRGKAFTLSLIYVLSLSCTYAAAGITAALFGVYIQGYMQNPYILSIFSIVFLFLGISTLGIYKLQLPKHLRKSLSDYNQLRSGSYLGAVIMGVFATLIASPCVAAPLAGVLAYVATSGNIKLGGIALFSMGLGVGSPIVIISAIGSELLQKAGKIQKYIKRLFGVILLGISIWLMSRVLSPQIIMLLWAALAIATAIYTGAISMTPQSSTSLTAKYHDRLINSLMKTISIMVLIYGCTLVFGAFMGNTDPLAPLGKKKPLIRTMQFTMSSFINITSKQQFADTLITAKQSSKPVLVFFTAGWCSACKDIKTQIFTEPEIQKLFEKFVLITIDLSDSQSETVQLARKFNVIGPPTIIFFDKKGLQSNLRFDSSMTSSQLEIALQTLN